MANLRCFTRFSYAVAINCSRFRVFVKVLQSHNTLCDRVLSGLVNSSIIQIMSMTNSAGFWPRLCSFYLRSTVAQAQSLCNSGSDPLQLWLRAL